MVTSTFFAMLRACYVVCGICVVSFPGGIASAVYAADSVRNHEAVVSTASLVVGRVIYRGRVPAPIETSVERDTEACGQVMTVTTIAVDAATHGVRDAVVSIRSEQEIASSEMIPVAPVQNRHCAFHPRVAALRVGAEMEITNDDPVMHNTNVTLDSRTMLNVAMVAGGNPVKKPFKKQGFHVVKCNVHKFMQAYRHVFSSPLFSQTNEAGIFRIQGLSPGLHTVSVWHETLGELHKEIHVPSSGTLNVDFEFK